MLLIDAMNNFSLKAVELDNIFRNMIDMTDYVSGERWQKSGIDKKSENLIMAYAELFKVIKFFKKIVYFCWMY